MNYKADLHIHTVLSPCASLEMSPDVIVGCARDKGLSIIGITDHNSTRQCSVVKKMASSQGIFVLCGAEVTTSEEVHCLAYFGTNEALHAFQQYLDEHLPDIPNDTRLFGDQVVVNEDNEIIYTESRALITAITASIDQTAERVHTLGGIFIPAHVDRTRFGILGQLGFFPPDLKADAIEISGRITPDEFLRAHPELKNYTVLTGSDAHAPDQIGTSTHLLNMNELSFENIKLSLSRNGS